MNSKAFPLFIVLVACLTPLSLAFAPNQAMAVTATSKPSGSSLYIFGNNKKAEAPPQPPAPKKTISGNRRQQLGIADNEDEYDLGVALANNTDPFITKVIAGSFILIMIALLIGGIIVPATTDYGEGVCRPLLTGGRC
eukprot:CAMPEP_0113608608 /NCGR_PEP_ID=MMETSP0017_2-20120614/4025_1 /TAXON_ID=2856 /ORGANISM="Cylindrotheca closterium" /LENGTH=137 /DNA_ID=CAMNT_0000517323 /DNA_START=26 /DNA_END=439 /DNA_ORIENTATION=- /assembly_acc=CAM_ASM_000147